jgi:hypothetical protein
MDGNELAGTGVLTPQTSTAAADFNGNYAFGLQALLTGSSEFDLVGQGSVTNGTTLSGTGIASDPDEFIDDSTVLANVPFTGVPSADGSNPGRYTMTGGNPLSFDGGDDVFNVVIYQSSGGQLFWLDIDGTQGLVFLGPIEQQGDLSSLSAIPAVKKAPAKGEAKQKP